MLTDADIWRVVSNRRGTRGLARMDAKRCSAARSSDRDKRINMRWGSADTGGAMLRNVSMLIPEVRFLLIFSA